MKSPRLIIIALATSMIMILIEVSNGLEFISAAPSSPNFEPSFLVTPTPTPPNFPPLPRTLPPAAPVRKPVGKVIEAASAFGPNLQLNADGSTLHNEPSLAIDPLNSNRLLASSNRFSPGPPSVYYTSTNGGSTWTEGTNSTTTGAQPWVDGWTAFDKLGNGYLANLGKPNGVYIGRLKPTNTWDAMIPLTVSVGSEFNDKPFVAVDQTSNTYANRIYVAWAHFTAVAYGAPRSIFLRYADANAWSTFSAPVNVSPSFATQVWWPTATVGADGAVYVDYLNYGYPIGNPTYLLLSKSMNGGVSFTNTYTIGVTHTTYNGGWDHLIGTINSGSPLYLSVNAGAVLVAHPTDPNLIAALWMDGYDCVSLTNCAHAHIVSSRSINGGITWSNPIVVNDDNDAGHRDHFFVAATVGSDGTIHAGWYDRRLILNCTNPYLYNEFYSYSTDWAQTWSRNVRVSTASSDPGNPLYAPGKVFIGDFSGIAVAGDGSAVWPIWTDARAGLQNIFTARAVPTVSTPLILNNCTFFPLIFR